MENKKNWTEEKGLILTIVILGIAVVVLFAYVYHIPNIQGAKKYSVKVIEIKGDCKDCFDVSAMATEVLKENATIKSRETLDYKSEEGKSAIEKYNVRSVPALILISKDLDKMNLDKKVFEIKNGYAIFDRSVPYIEMSSGKINGLVNMKEISPSNCPDCNSLTKVEKQLESFGVKVENYEMLSQSSGEGANLTKELGLKTLPALLISKDIKQYWWFFGQIESLFEDKGDYYLFKEPLPPYVELSSGKVKGKVDITYLSNKSCEDCYNVSLLKESFQGLGVYIDGENSVDVSSAQGIRMLKEYNITAIPTVVLSDDLSDYADSMKKRLVLMGTFENDGSYVFRKIEALGKDIKFQKIG